MTENPITLDEKDHNIISLLRKNSRRSIREIAKETAYRPSTVHQRIQRLIKSGVIESFTLKLNQAVLGTNFIVFMLLTSDRMLPKEAFSYEPIKEVFGITGEYDILIKMRFHDVEEFNDFILSYRKDYDLRKTVTMVATVTLKEEL